MNYTVVVPEPISDEISAWGISIEAEELLYEQLESDLADGPGKCARLPAPAPTFVHVIEFQDPAILGITHRCTFWLTFGERDFTLYVRQVDYSNKERWGDPDPDDEPPHYREYD